MKNIKDLIRWTPDLSVGIGDIDTQHREFISILQKLAENIGKNENQRIEDTIDFLEKYAEVHFNLEQMYMTVFSYPDSIEHINAHKEFKKEITNLRKKADKKQLKIEDVNKKLKSYFFGHIKTIDMELASFLIKKIKI
ncbi:MAG: bacteriohemerythrin [Candidatus Goldbacteria bacterium]|nr:bacteriohemerythrin [Candidatus Goldiibacteriota bacterium]